MYKNLLFAGLFSLISSALVAQETDNANNTVSDVSAIKPSENRKTSVRLYPNPSYGKISVTATTSTPLHFYIFDLDGTMVYQAVLNNKDRKIIDSLKKGTYLYDVFEKDESIEEGKIVIK